MSFLWQGTFLDHCWIERIFFLFALWSRQSWNITLAFRLWMNRIRDAAEKCSIWDSQPNPCDLSISVKKNIIFFSYFSIFFFLQAFVTCAVRTVPWKKDWLKLWNSKTRHCICVCVPLHCVLCVASRTRHHVKCNFLYCIAYKYKHILGGHESKKHKLGYWLSCVKDI